jgi:hypothetical protein
MRQWGRMLDAHRHGESIAIEASVPADAFNDAKLVEEIVMSWAAEHPEPVYPTWLEWLKSMGVIPYLMGLVTVRDVDGTFDDGHVNITENALKEIPADIAQKLGLQPKEGTT